jgi:diguanylate cyclase (GGDEF)-like protein
MRVFPPTSRAKTYPTFRLTAVLILSLHLGIRLIFPQPAIFPDLFLFNSAAICAAVATLYSPLFNDHWASTSLGSAFLLWSIGSILSTANSFFSFTVWPNLADICYSLFYPFALFGIVRALTARRKVKWLELLDTVILALGITSIVAGFLIKPAMLHFSGSTGSVFLSLLYPSGDISLLAITLALVLLTRKSLRSMLLLLGVAAFTATDLIFLLMSANSAYPFASLNDDGWIIGMILIAESLYHHGGEIELSERFAPITTVFAVIVSSVALLIAAISPTYLPKFILIPGFATIGFAFLRMQAAISDAKNTNEERELARTDELTGLPNRRRFLLELDLLIRKEGTLLLLDLDGFKAVNDGYGHPTGDQLLKQIAIRFSRALPANALLARLGGDEFGVIVFGDPEIGLETALALRATLTYPFALPAATVEVGVSIGRVITQAERFTQEDLLRRADLAMYEAKRTKAGIVLWSDSLIGS